MTTFQITPNPRIPARRSAFGVLSISEPYTIRAIGGTASGDAFLNAIRAAYPANQSNPTYDNITVVGVREFSVDTPNSCYTYMVDYAQTDSGGVPPDSSSLVELELQPSRLESVTYDFYQQDCETDYYGNPIIDSAGTPKNPPGFADRSRAVVVLSTFLLGYDGARYKPLFGTLNDAPYVLSGFGLCDTRTVRLLNVRPASGFNPSITVISSATSGTAARGDPLTWGSGFSGYYGTPTIVGTSGAFTILNPIGPVAIGDTISSTTSFSATSLNAASPPVMKTFASFEWRETGFDYPEIDQGNLGWWTDGTHSTASQIISINAGSVIAPLRGGVPSTYAMNSSDTTYTSLPKGGHWDTATTSDYLLARVTLGQVNRTSNGQIDLVTFKRLGQSDFSELPF